MLHLSTSLQKRYGDLLSLFPIRPKILLACLPKTASTFLQNTIADLCGFSTASLVQAQSDSEQTLSVNAVLDNYFRPVVTHLHVRASQQNLKIMRRFNLKSCVIVRNIFDIIISFRDHLSGRPGPNPWVFGLENFTALPENEQYDQVIDAFAPWALHFFWSWTQASERGAVQTLWLSYEDLVQDKPAAIQDILRFHDIHRQREEIGQAVARIEQAKTTRANFNKGLVGRGRALLSEAQRERVKGMAARFKHFDFSRLGL